jgi:hypothetical protein
MKLLLGSTALALALGLAAYPSGPAAAQQIQYACDANDDGFVDATESRLCTDREFDEIAAGEEVLTEELLAAQAEGDTPMTFSDFDADGDGQITREEWSGYVEERFAGAAEATGGQMTTEEYSIWREEGMRP